MRPLNQLENNVPNYPQVDKKQVAFVKNMLAQKGISAEAMVRQVCSQRGINVDEFMAQFKDVTLP